jgi:hydroxyacylglutathione hydrolase
LSDNFCFHVEHGATSFIVDCSEPEKVLSYMDKNNSKFSHIFTTHKHNDHSGGNILLKEQIPSLEIVGGVHDNIPGCTIPVQDG